MKLMDPPLTGAGLGGRARVEGRRGRSLFRLGLVDRLRVMVFPMIHGATGEGPVFAELPDVGLSLTRTSVIDDRLVLLDYRLCDG
jgi:riboflavin biosynthesis pyrimidine reductase